MISDKNEEKRYQLTQKLNQLEQEENHFRILKRNFEQSLESFFTDFQYLANRERSLLEQEMSHLHHNLGQDWDKNQQLQLQLRQYVDASFTEVAEIDRDFRFASQDKREALLKERNQLPWD